MAADTPSKKRKALSLDTKFQILSAVDSGVKSKIDIASEFCIPASTLSTILKQRENIVSAYNSSDFGGARKKLRTSQFTDVEDALFKWFRTARDANIPLTGPTLAAKADGLAIKLGYSDFTANHNWVERFKQRRGIVSKVVCGESGSVDQSITSDYVQNTLPNLLKDYVPRDVFNMDETGLFYKLLPNRTLQMKSENCHGGKRSKDRLTVVVCANMDGTEKLKPLVIGKSAKPRCLKNVKSLPVDYRANARAWMTSGLYEMWLRGVNSSMARQKRNILLFVDNCPAHPKVDRLSNVTVVFLPPNTTSKLQPMDQGIIWNLKMSYRRMLIQKLIECHERKEKFEINVYTAMIFVHRAWRTVTQKTISNCFLKAGFKASDNSEEIESDDGDSDDDDDVPLAYLKQAWSTVVRETEAPTDLNFEDYVSVDSDVIVAEKPSDDDIVADIQQQQQQQSVKDASSDESDDDDEDSLSAPPTCEKTIECVAYIRRFLNRQNTVSDRVFDCVSDLETFIGTCRAKLCKQTMLNDFLLLENNQNKAESL